MKLVVANLKMNLTLPKMLEYIKTINNVKYDNIELVICPSYPYISILSLENNKHYYIGSQDVSYYSDNSYTGEVSACQLSSMNVKYCIVGHSERKKVYNESNIHIISKINNLSKNNIIPILCIEDTTRDSIKNKLDEILPNISNLNDIVIAYEPIKSIGTGIIPKIKEIDETIQYIRRILNTNYKINYKILYGGSVDKINIREILKITDGVLIGKSCIDINNFIELLNKIEVIK